MLNYVEVRSETGNGFRFNVGRLEDSFFLRNVSGLDPVPAVLVSSSFANLDGAQYQSARRDIREITISVGLVASSEYSVQQLRRRLYGAYMPKSRVSLRFALDDGLVVDISGRVKSFESEMFTRDPSATITVTCFNPDFEDTALVTITGGSSNTAEISFPYAGTVDTGFLFSMNVNRTLSSVSLQLTSTSLGVRTMDFIYPMVSGDQLRISTVAGNKFARLTRSGSTANLIYAVSPYSDWLRINPDTMNKLKVVTGGASIPYTVEYTDKYGGL